MREVDVHGTGRLVEIARLGTPIVEVSLVTCCCGRPVPHAKISINGEHFGVTDVAPLNCGVRIGEHYLLAEHSLLSTPGLCVPLQIAGATTCGVNINFPLDRLRFVCTAAPGTRTPNADHETHEARADLWLVGGDLAQWRCSRVAPPMDAEVWLWDGELGEQNAQNAHNMHTLKPLKVQAGALSRHDWSELRGEEKDVSEDSGQGQTSGGHCFFTESLAKPCASFGPWRVVLHCAPKKGNECAVTRLARLATGDVPALWLARLLADEDAAEGAKTATKTGPLLHVHSTCCSASAKGVTVFLNGEEAGEIDENGDLNLPKSTGSCTVGIKGVPSCLLPGSTNEYLAHFNRSRLMDLELTCLVWIYWMQNIFEPDEDQPDENPIEEDGMVFVCADVEQIPDEAKPVLGRLYCPEAEEPEIILDGQSVGPVLLRRSRLSKGSTARCLVAQLTVDVVPPASLGPGVTFVARNPSPLLARYEEFGDCEFQNLMKGAPLVIGDLKLCRMQAHASEHSDEGAESESPNSPPSPTTQEHDGESDDPYANDSFEDPYANDSFEDEDDEDAGN